MLYLLQVLQSYIAAEIPTDKRNSHVKKMYQEHEKNQRWAAGVYRHLSVL